MIGRRAAVAVVAACALAGSVSAGATSFSDEFRGPASALGRAFAATVARSLPVTSASPGITFTYDATSGAFERNTELLGQLYLERARPIGRGKWNVATSYQRVNIDSVQGQALDSLRDNSEAIVTEGRVQQAPPVKGVFPIKYDRYAVGLTVNEVTLAATYGITDNLDVNLTLPILISALSINATGRVFRVDPNSGPNGGQLVRAQTGVGAGLFADVSSNATGVGDLFLRGKYRFLARPWGELASGLVLRMPTGNQNNFQGTGDWELSPLLYANTRRFPVAGRMAVQFFANAGLDLNIGAVGQSQGRYGVGADFALADVMTLSLAFLGREPFQGFTPDGFFDVPRYRPSNQTCQPDSTRGCPTAPLFGLETVRPSYYSLSLGGRVNMWRDTVFGFANVLIPLSNQGIHTDVIPLVGVEATF